MGMFGFVVAAAMAIADPAGTAIIENDAPASITPLWQTINLGDSPEAVAEKLRAMPEVKEVKLRLNPKKPDEPKFKIRFHAVGFRILSSIYEPAFEFRNGGIQQIGLTSNAMCMNDVARQYEQMVDAITPKYPERIGPRITAADMARAMQTAIYSEKDAGLATSFANNETAVVFIQKIRASPLPPVGYVDSKLMRALRDVAVAQYRQASSECDGTGAVRTAWQLIYMPRRVLTDETTAIEDRMSAEMERATAGL